MKRLKSTCVASVTAGLLFSLFALLGNSAVAQDGFYDNFEDRDVTDGMPVTWVPLGNSDLDAETGDLLVSGRVDIGNVYFSGARVLDTYSDVSLRTQVRLTEGQWIAVTVRDGSSPITRQYVGAIAEDGSMNLGRLFPGNNLIFADETTTDFRPKDEDLMMQIDAIGDTIDFWVWRTNDQMPSAPHLSFDDVLIDDGFITINFGSEINEDVSGILRFVQVDTTSIPEPTCAVLCISSLIGLLTFRRRHT